MSEENQAGDPQIDWESMKQNYWKEAETSNKLRDEIAAENERGKRLFDRLEAILPALEKLAGN